MESIPVNRDERLVDIRLRPLWAYIDGVREFGRFFCRTTFESDEIAEQVRLVIQEMLENAVKYSESEWSEVRFVLCRENQRVLISVSNYPTEEAAQDLLEQFDWVSASEPQEAFADALRRAATQTDGSSKLGLARMRFEGGVELSVKREADGRVQVTACRSL